MPIREIQLYGTDKDGFHIEDYCIYCYKDGKFTEDVTMDEMIRLCARYVKGNSQKLAIANMKLLYPHLKRWAQKETTQHEYHKAINKVLEYIQENIGENTDLKTLAAIANISPYHFHRIFRSTIGESLAGYVKRLRLEYVVEKLNTSGLSLEELALRTGYSSVQALSRAFKQYFGIPPTAFRTSYFEEQFESMLNPRICRISEKFAFMLSNKEDRGNWQKLYAYALFSRLLSGSSESLELIQAGILEPCLTSSNLPEGNKHIKPVTLPGGLYAIFTYRGETGNLSGFINAIKHYWLPKSKYMLLNTSTAYIKHLSLIPPPMKS